jgi:hypothetical protein
MDGDEAKEMPLSVALIRVLSVLMILIGFAQFIISGILLGESSGQNVGGIYFAVTAVCAGFWGICMVEGVRQFNMLSLFLFMNLVCAIVAVVYAGIDSYVVKRIEACAVFDPDGGETPRCSEQEPSTYSNFTCSGNDDYYIDAAKCGTRFVAKAGSNNDCACVYLDGGTHCKEFAGYDSCAKMQEVLPQLSLGTYALGYACLSLSIFLMICSCVAACFHSKRRGLMSVSAEELRQTDRRGQLGGGLRVLRGFRVGPVAAVPAAEPANRTVQMVRVQASPVAAEEGRAPAESPSKADATRSPAQTGRKKQHKPQGNREETGQEGQSRGHRRQHGHEEADVKQ